MQTKVKYVIFSLLPALILLVAMEGIFRLLGMGEPFSATLGMWDAPLELQLQDPYTGFRLRPHAKIGSINLNSLGYRDDEFNNAATIKILCLGDSVAFGWGVHDPKDTYAEQLEKILSDKGVASKRTVEVFNAGIPSYQLYKGFQLYLKYLAALGRWDYVICSFAWNEDLDLENVGDSQELEYGRRNPPDEIAMLRALRKIAERSRTYNVLESVYVSTFFAKEINDRQYPFTHYENLLRDFAKAVRSNDSRLVLLAAQVREEDKKNSHGQPMLQLNAIAQKVAGQENIPYVDTDLAFLKNGSGWYDSVHFDEKGHRITAEVLGAILARELGL